MKSNDSQKKKDNAQNNIKNLNLKLVQIQKPPVEESCCHHAHESEPSSSDKLAESSTARKLYNEKRRKILEEDKIKQEM